MAKVKGLLKGAKGKYAGGTLYTSGGETILREVVDVKNPSTVAQVLQRVIAKQVGAQYKAMKEIANHSFEGRGLGAECANRFRSLNLRYIRERAAELQAAGTSLYDFVQFQPIKSVKYTPTVVYISEGTLPEVPAAITPMSDQVSAKMKVALSANTYKAWLDAYDLQRGDQVTFCTVEKSANGNYTFHYARVILDPRTSEGEPASMEVAFIVDGAINAPNYRNQGKFYGLAFNTDHIQFSLTSGNVAAAAVIVSRKGNNYWFRSTAKMVLSEAVLGDDACGLMEAVDAGNTGTVAIDVESEQYLNNAGTGGSQGSSSAGGEGAEVVVNNTIQLGADAQNLVSQNVAGGSFNISGPIGIIKVTGQNLSDGLIQYNDVNSTEEAYDFEGSDTEVILTITPNLTEGDTAYIFKNGVLWFTINVTGSGQQGGGTTAVVNEAVQLTPAGTKTIVGNHMFGGGMNITKVKFTGSNLNQLSLKSNTTNNIESATDLTLNAGNTEAVWEGTLAASASMYFFKNGALWFQLENVEEENG